MREILFRGKRKDNGAWEYGSLVKLNKIKCTECTIVMPENFSAVVSPETVGEYTGYKDVNGKMIYEGDILKVEQVMYDEEKQNPTVYKASIYQVIFQHGSWCMFKGADWILEYQMLYKNPDIEVIGNIYDNPGLLKDCQII